MAWKYIVHKNMLLSVSRVGYEIATLRKRVNETVNEMYSNL